MKFRTRVAVTVIAFLTVTAPLAASASATATDADTLIAQWTKQVTAAKKLSNNTSLNTTTATLYDTKTHTSSTFIDQTIKAQKGTEQALFTTITGNQKRIEGYRCIQNKGATDPNDRKCWGTTNGKTWKPIPSGEDGAGGLSYSHMVPALMIPEKLTADMKQYPNMKPATPTVSNGWVTGKSTYPNGDTVEARVQVTTHDHVTRATMVNLFNNVQYSSMETLYPAKPLVIRAP